MSDDYIVAKEIRFYRNGGDVHMSVRIGDGDSDWQDMKHFLAGSSVRLVQVVPFPVREPYSFLAIFARESRS